MTNQTTETTTENKNGKPAFIAYSVREYEAGGEQKSHWAQIGAMWGHKNGDGFSLQLDAVPLDGRIVLRQPKEKEAPQA